MRQLARTPEVNLRPSGRLWLLVSAPTALALVGAVYLSWLLWRYVPPHAALFEGLGTSLPPEARIPVVASNWFVRVLPFVVLLAFGLGGLVLVPLATYGVYRRRRWAIGTVVVIMAVLGIVELGSCALVLHGVHVGCSRASADPRFADEVAGIRRMGESVCSTVG
jgi:type II secretory pathway component PulF